MLVLQQIDLQEMSDAAVYYWGKEIGMAFFVGQKVVCVNADNTPGRVWNGDAPTKGCIYPIRFIGVSRLTPGPMFHLEEIERSETSRIEWGYETGYGAWRFRPLEYQSIKDLIARVISPDKTRRIPVDADGDLMR